MVFVITIIFLFTLFTLDNIDKNGKIKIREV